MGKNAHSGMEILLLCCMLLVNLSDNCIIYAKTSSVSQNGVQIQQKTDDKMVIPDKYNVEHKIEVSFKNCKFSHFAGNRKSSNITFKFERCSFYNFYRSDATFNRCKFGKSFNDGLNPFQNVIIKNCFFTDFGSMKSKDAAVHTDGTQIYRWKDIDVKNIVYENCRFEIPLVASAGSKAGVNACIMLQLEFSNAENIKFQDCILNGGGYSIYA